jgi:hypothetical protein
MDGERPADALSDSALEREIESALAADPSPEFLARVRTRIASEPAPAAWAWWRRGGSSDPPVRWPLLTAGAGVAVVVIAMLVPWTRSTPLESPRQVAASEDVTLEPPVRLKPDTTPEGESVRSVRLQADPEAAEGQSVRSARLQADPDARPFPEVLISEDEQRAFELFVVAVQQGRMPDVPAADPATDMGFLEIPDVAIAPLVIEPLPQIARLELGERP